MKARLIPFKLISFVDKALDELTNAGVLVKIESSDWVTIVPVLKADGSIRICGDYQVTINSKLIIEHPLSTTDELFAKIAGEKKFSKIHLRQAYLQLEVSSKNILL